MFKCFPEEYNSTCIVVIIIVKFRVISSEDKERENKEREKRLALKEEEGHM